MKDCWETTKAKPQFAEAIEKRMKQLSISESAAANRCRVPRTYFSNLLRGFENTTVREMSNIAFSLGSRLEISVV